MAGDFGKTDHGVLEFGIHWESYSLDRYSRLSERRLQERHEDLRRKLRKIAKNADNRTLTMQISKYFNEKEKAHNGGKCHNSAENFIMCSDCKKYMQRR